MQTPLKDINLCPFCNGRSVLREWGRAAPHLSPSPVGTYGEGLSGGKPAKRREVTETLERAGYVIIQDPQPAPLLSYVPDRHGKWIWRCHIDASHPYRSVLRIARNFVQDYDASVFSLAAFAQKLPRPQYIIPPSIDPLCDKNRMLPDDEVRAVAEELAKMKEIGAKAREFVRDNFLLTRHLREYLTMLASLHFGCDERIELK